MHRVLIGESYVGDGAEAAHVNTVLGDRDGPAGGAWVTALANNRAATRAALAAGASGAPSVADVLAARREPANPFFTLAPAT